MYTIFIKRMTDNMWELSFAGIDFFELFYCFFMYCFCGWIWECCYCSTVEGKLINRGFLNGPVIPIYGCAATGIFLAFFNDKMIALTTENTPKAFLSIFLIGAVVASLLEYVTSFTMEKLFHAKWWDYSHVPLNIKGRICLPVSAFWGLLSIFLVKVLHPMVLNIISSMNRDVFEIIGYVIIVIFLADLVSTVIATVSLDHKITAIAKIKAELSDFADFARQTEVEKKTLFKEKYGETKVGDVIEHGMDRIDATIAFMMQGYEERKDDFSDKIDDKIAKVDKVLASNKVHIDTLKDSGKDKYTLLASHIKEGLNKIGEGFKGYNKYTAGRFSLAFPTMKFTGIKAGVIEDIKKHVNSDKKKDSDESEDKDNK